MVVSTIRKTNKTVPKIGRTQSGPRRIIPQASRDLKTKQESKRHHSTKVSVKQRQSRPNPRIRRKTPTTVQSSMRSPEIIPQAHAQQVGSPVVTPTSSNPLGGIIAVGQDFYTGAANVGADYAGMVDPKTYTSEEPVESKSHVWKVQDAAIEQAVTFAFDRPEFERLSKEGNLPFDTALSKASKVAPAQLVGGLAVEAAIWIGTAGLGRAVWGVSRGVKLSRVAAKAIGKAKGTVPNVIKLGGVKGKMGAMVDSVSFPTTRRGGAWMGLKEATASMKVDPFQIMGSARGGGIPKFVPLIGGKGSTFTKHSLPKGPGKITSKMRAKAQTTKMPDNTDFIFVAGRLRKKITTKNPEPEVFVQARRLFTKKTTTKKTAPKKTTAKKVSSRWSQPHKNLDQSLPMQKTGTPIAGYTAAGPWNIALRDTLMGLEGSKGKVLKYSKQDIDLTDKGIPHQTYTRGETALEKTAAKMDKPPWELKIEETLRKEKLRKANTKKKAHAKTRSKQKRGKHLKKLGSVIRRHPKKTALVAGGGVWTGYVASGGRYE